MAFCKSKSASLSALFLLLLLLHQTHARERHVINFRSPDLYPESFVWDPSAGHFIVGSLRDRSIYSVSTSGAVKTLISDPSLPTNATFGGLALDPERGRILAVVISLDPLPPFNALAAYDLQSGRRVFLAPLPRDPEPAGAAAPPDFPNDVTFDGEGNAYVTNSGADLIWKVKVDGEASVFSKAPAFTSFPVDRDAPFSSCGLNGIAYVSSGYLLVVQTNTGKMYKVNVDDGSATTVVLNEELTSPDDIVVRPDGVVLVVSIHKLWFLKSEDNWGEGAVFDRAELDKERFPTSVTVGKDGKEYVLYGNVGKGIAREDEEGREWFEIEEVWSEKAEKDDKVWMYVLVGLGLAYFGIWRFQMRKLVHNMNKKHA